MPFSYVAAASAVNSLTGGAITNALGFGGSSGTAGGGSYSTPAGTQAAADPYAAYRGTAAGLYNEALTSSTLDPSKMPGFSAFQTGVVNPALEASKRTSAASGMLRSGGEQASLQKTAQQGYYGFMTDYLNRLAQASGATQNPATAASLGAGVYAANQQGVSQGLGAISTLSGLFNTASNNYTMLSNNAAMSSSSNYLDAAGQLPSQDYSGFVP